MADGTKRGTVTCCTVDGPLDVPARLTPNLAVHKSLVDGKYDARASDDWTLTHRTSGLAMNWYDTQQEAVAAAKKLEGDCPSELGRIAKFAHGEDLRKGSAVGRRLREALGR